MLSSSAVDRYGYRLGTTGRLIAAAPYEAALAGFLIEVDAIAVTGGEAT